MPTIFIDDFLSHGEVCEDEDFFDTDDAKSNDEEDFEFEDEEAMIEAAHTLEVQNREDEEVQRQIRGKTGMLESSQLSMREEEVVEVVDGRGDMVRIPASAFEGVEEDDEGGEGESCGRKRARTESLGESESESGEEQWRLRWRLHRIGNDAWVRTSYRFYRN